MANIPPSPLNVPQTASPPQYLNVPQTAPPRPPLNIPMRPLPRPPKKGFNPIPLIIGIIVVVLLIVGIIIFVVVRNSGSGAGTGGGNTGYVPPTYDNPTVDTGGNTSGNTGGNTGGSSGTPPPPNFDPVKQSAGSLVDQINAGVSGGSSGSGDCSKKSIFSSIFRNKEPKDEGKHKMKSMEIDKSNGNPCPCFEWCANNSSCMGFKYTPNFSSSKDKCYFMNARLSSGDLRSDTNKIYFQRA